MSRIGQKPIAIPDGVSVSQTEGLVVIRGPGGELSQQLLDGVSCQTADDGRCLSLTRVDDSRQAKSRHGLLRSLVANMVVGVTDGFEKRLEINGIGFKTQLEGSNLVLNVGFSHPVKYSVPDDVKIELDRNLIIVRGVSKQRVGQAAAEIRAIKKPEPYKGKGIKYVDEVIVRKTGKGAKE